MGEQLKAFFHTFARMKRFWNILFLVLICNIAALVVRVDYAVREGEPTVAEITAEQNAECVVATPSNFEQLRNPETFVAIVNNNVVVTESVTGKSISNQNHKFYNAEHSEKFFSCKALRVINKGGHKLNFSRASDHYIYELRHIRI